MAELQETVREDGVTQVAIIGKLDMRGLHAVDMRFHGYTAARRKHTLVDLSQLEFISSLGVGMLISCARSMARHGAKMVLVKPQPLVEEVLVAVGIHEVIPIVRSIDEGLAALKTESERMQDMPALAMTIPKEIAALEELLPALEAFVAAHAIPARQAFVAQLALEEMGLNLIKYSHGPSHQIAISVQRHPTKLMICLEDDGQPFDPRAVPKKTFDQPLQERQAGGMGLHLVLSLVDEIRYHRLGDRNRLEMDIGLPQQGLG